MLELLPKNVSTLATNANLVSCHDLLFRSNLSFTTQLQSLLVKTENQSATPLSTSFQGLVYCPTMSASTLKVDNIINQYGSDIQLVNNLTSSSTTAVKSTLEFDINSPFSSAEYKCLNSTLGANYRSGIILGLDTSSIYGNGFLRYANVQPSPFLEMGVSSGNKLNLYSDRTDITSALYINNVRLNPTYESSSVSTGTGTGESNSVSFSKTRITDITFSFHGVTKTTGTSSFLFIQLGSGSNFSTAVSVMTSVTQNHYGSDTCVASSTTGIYASAIPATAGNTYDGSVTFYKLSSTSDAREYWSFTGFCMIRPSNPAFFGGYVQMATGVALNSFRLSTDSGIFNTGTLKLLYA